MNDEIKKLLRETYPAMTLKEIAEELGTNWEYFNKTRSIGMKLAAKLARATGKPIMFFYKK